MKKLVLDIETAPNVSEHWGLWNQNIGLSQVREFTRVIAFAAKWHGQRSVLFYSDYHHGHEAMIAHAWRLWDEADAVIHFNGTSFDLRHLRREFALAIVAGSLTGPPSPVAEIDIMRVVKKQFFFQSNKLDHISQQLGLQGKVSHEGHGLWSKCLQGDDKAWRKMRRYNIGDVNLTEEVYNLLLPWIDNHPHTGLYSGEEGVCPRCGSPTLKPRGFSYTQLSKFQRYRCDDCGSWSRGKFAVDHVDERAVKQ